MAPRARGGIVGKLRWFHPGLQDTVIFLWLFLLRTGWNLSTALSLDISSSDAWHEDHIQHQGYKVIHAFKGRADKHQFTLSMAKPEWHPFKIVTFMIERTAALRQTLRLELTQKRQLYATSPSPALKRRVAQLESFIRSPWLYHSMSKVGEVAALSGLASSYYNEVVREVVRRHGLELKYPSLLDIGTSQARDAWIGHAYRSSQHNVTLTQLAAQHRDGRIITHYISRHRYRARSEKILRAVQNAAFYDISNGQILDAARLRLIVSQGGITAEQEKRLLDRRQRTRLGMGCVEPHNPPPEISPDHTPGSTCRVQRCTGCRHGLVFDDSLHLLARARAELIYIKRSIPYASWLGSSFEDEERSIDATLALFEADDVRREIDQWLKNIEQGDASVYDTYPSY
jgi:hypothetical protein